MDERARSHCTMAGEGGEHGECWGIPVFLLCLFHQMVNRKMDRGSLRVKVLELGHLVQCA